MYKRIVVKVGTKVLSTEEGNLNIAVLKRLVGQISEIKNGGIEVVLVTSGAMGAGRGLISVKTVEKAAGKQVLAAVGQVKLMSKYSELFAKEGQVCAQVLATKEDFRDRVHYLNMRTCFENLLRNDVIPVVNENDVVATTELLFTDNDELAGMVASQIGADAVMILTSVDGFLATDTKTGSPKIVPEIGLDNIGDYHKYISPNGTTFGRGGMLTKLNVAKKLMLQGVTVYFANGKRKDVLTELIDGRGVGTRFSPRSRPSAIKRRLAYSEGLSKGSIQINKCAEDLLLSKNKIMSLLPVGVVRVSGDFDKGDIIEIVGDKKRKLGFGIAEYGAIKARELMGAKRARPVIHYDHMFIDA